MCVRCKPGTIHRSAVAAQSARPTEALSMTGARTILDMLHTIKPGEVKGVKQDVKLLNRGGR